MAWVQINDGMWADVDSEGNASNWSTTDPTNKWWETAQRVPIPGSYQGGVVNPQTGKVEPFVAFAAGDGGQGQTYLPQSEALKQQAEGKGYAGSEVRPKDFSGFDWGTAIGDYGLKAAAALFAAGAGGSLFGAGGASPTGGALISDIAGPAAYGGAASGGSTLAELAAAFEPAASAGSAAANAGGLQLAEAGTGLPSAAVNTFGQGAVEGAGAGTAGTGASGIGQLALPGAGVAGAAALGSGGGFNFSPADLGQINPGTSAPWQNLMTPDPSNILNINNPINLGSSSPGFQLPSLSIPIPGAASDSAQFGTPDAPAGAIPGGAPGTPGAAAGTALSRLLNGTATADDLASLAGKVAPALLGAYASNQQSGQLADLAKQQQAFGAPSRARFEASMSPGFDPTSIPGYSGALSTTSDTLLRRLSATGGNPYGNPGALTEASKAIVSGTALPAIQNYQQQNSQAGGYGSINAAAPQTAAAAIGSNANLYNSIGAGISDVTNPQMDLSAILKQLAGKSTSAYGLA